MVIKKISFDSINYIDVEGELDLEKRILILSLEYNDFKKVFNFYYGELKENYIKLKKYIKCFIINNNNILYTCSGCIWGFNEKNSIIKACTAPIDLIIENRILKDELHKVKITELSFKTSYPLYTNFKFHIALFDIKLDRRKKISISESFEDDKHYIYITIKSSTAISFKKMSKVLYSIVEMFFLILGDIPKLESINLCDKVGTFNLYRELVDKYHQRDRINPKNEIIGNISPKSINSKTIRDFMQFRDKTNILFDMLMIDMNNNGYVEINNSSLLQLLEGVFKTIGPYKNENFREIMHYYFKINKSTKFVLSRRDKKMVNVGATSTKDYIFVNKSVGHRNYLSHLDVKTNRDVFIKLENNYAYWKLSLCVRLYIMDFLNISIDKKEVKELLKSIDNWAVKNHLRYKV